MLADDRTVVGVVRQLELLDSLLGELAEMIPGTPGAREKLYQAHVIAQSLYSEARGHPNGGRPDKWFLSVLGLLNGCAARHGLEESSMPFEL